MKSILVTGSRGFIGQNLCVALRRQSNIKVLEFSSQQTPAELVKLCARADLVFHLAGVNRPKSESEFQEGNADLTRRVCEAMTKAGRGAPLVISSSIQAELDNAYGRSKRAAEEAVLDYNRLTGAPAYLFRFPNVFGKWSRPNYNSVVATFCHNISHGLPVEIRDRNKSLKLVYVDDVIHTFLEITSQKAHDLGTKRLDVPKTYLVTLGELHDVIRSFQDARKRAALPDISNPFAKCLYATFIASIDPRELAVDLPNKKEKAGRYFQVLKCSQTSDVLLCQTKPGTVVGGHYHDTNCERVCVVQGKAVIQLRRVGRKEVFEYSVSGKKLRAVDIPPGYVHTLKNVGTEDMIAVCWATDLHEPHQHETISEDFGETIYRHAKATQRRGSALEDFQI